MKKSKRIISLMLCFLLAASLFTVNTGEVQAAGAGNYILQVNKGTNVVTVYRKDGTAERAFICSVGTATPLGTFYTPNKYRWHELDGPSYGQYCTRIVNGILFHSVWYYRNGDYASQSYVQYNKLGSTASHGCVRLTVADAKWIYDNCPLGTEVRIIYGSSANDPLGKPASIKVPNTGTGWDPTDPMSGNPYSSAMPSIDTSGASRTVSYGSDFNPLTGIVARDSLGNDISGNLAYAGKVNTKKLGDYKITYRITDALGRTAYADVVYTVADTGKAKITGVKKNQTKEYKSTLKLKKNIKASTASGKNLTKQIKIKVIYPGSKKEKTYKKNTLKLTKLGTYKINYYVTHPDNKQVTKVTSTVKVRDTKKPKFSGISSQKTIEYGSVLNLKSGIRAKLVSGKNMTSKIEVRIKAPNKEKFKKLSSSQYKNYRFIQTGVYTVRYTVKNPNNKKAAAVKEMTVTVVDTAAPVISGVTDLSAEIGTALNLRAGVTAALVSGQDVTAGIRVTVTAPAGNSSEFTGTDYTFDQPGIYTVMYTAVNPANSQAAVQAIRRVTVTDNRIPVISIDANKLKAVETNVPYNVYEGVSALVGQTTVSGVTAQITNESGQVLNIVNGAGMAVFAAPGTYTITYTAANPNNPAKTGTAQFTLTVTSPVNPAGAPAAPVSVEPEAEGEVQPEPEQPEEETGNIQTPDNSSTGADPSRSPLENEKQGHPEADSKRNDTEETEGFGAEI